MAETSKKTQKNLYNYWDCSESARALKQKVAEYYKTQEGFMGYRDIDRVMRTENAIVDSLLTLDNRFGADRRNESVRNAYKNAARKVLDEYRRFNIVCADGHNYHLPKKRKKFDASSRIYRSTERCGMPLEQFLLYLKGDVFLKDEEKLPKIGEWIHEKPNKIEYVFNVIMVFIFSEAKAHKLLPKHNRANECIDIKEGEATPKRNITVNNYGKIEIHNHQR